MDGNFMLCETCKKMILVGHGSKLLIKRNKVIFIIKTFRFLKFFVSTLYKYNNSSILCLLFVYKYRFTNFLNIRLNQILID
uniref:Uncharacterized protein n=1 Tax=Amorphochlora amoebiformis TaxID=1561963 RepID=A0A0H5BQY6_9EUKA|nr:hypothetical protein [Amorphochlora amoebiformis]